MHIMCVPKCPWKVETTDYSNLYTEVSLRLDKLCSHDEKGNEMTVASVILDFIQALGPSRPTCLVF